MQGDSRETSAPDYLLGGVRANSASPSLLSQTLIFWRRAIKPNSSPTAFFSMPSSDSCPSEGRKQPEASNSFSRRACRGFCLEQLFEIATCDTAGGSMARAKEYRIGEIEVSHP